MTTKLPVLTFILCILCINLSAAQDRREWYIPDYVKLQFAGNIGFLSLGTGYVHGNGKLETDILLGYLPKKIGGDDIVSLTGKMTYSPWKLPLGKRLTATPLSTGLYLSYSFGSQFDTILPNEYPNGYYWWASSLRVGGFLGGNIAVNLKKSSSRKVMSIYYELGAYDLELISYIQNMDYLRLSDIISLALGVRFGVVNR